MPLLALRTATHEAPIPDKLGHQEVAVRLKLMEKTVYVIANTEEIPALKFLGRHQAGRIGRVERRVAARQRGQADRFATWSQYYYRMWVGQPHSAGSKRDQEAQPPCEGGLK